MSGIPTVANHTPGLMEALGDAGIWVKRDDIAAWTTTLQHVESQYTTYAQRAADWGRKKDAEAEHELQQVEDFLHKIKQRRCAA